MSQKTFASHGLLSEPAYKMRKAFFIKIFKEYEN